ncbi:MAG: TRAP transporter small permease [Synergistales bacterium]|nr:TRAP transporter small permease [Synergistales bacterium]
MNAIIRCIDRISRLGGVLSGILIVLGTLLVSSEIVARTFLGTTLYISAEYAGYCMAALTALALAYTLQEKGHIRMTFLHTALHGRKRLILDLICYGVGFVFCILLTYATWNFFWDSVVSGTKSMGITETYLAIPQSFLFIGAVMLMLQFVAEFFRDLQKLRRGETENVGEAVQLGR